ncbi:MAG TPA: hypothetical protein PLO58_09415, partial [Candidatus Marinimicrobia bacterium]|nr:hypothetical protein [Candidatus Neomarinimicrobiota bacterium]
QLLTELRIVQVLGSTPLGLRSYWRFWTQDIILSYSGSTPAGLRGVSHFYDSGYNPELFMKMSIFPILLNIS